MTPPLDALRTRRVALRLQLRFMNGEYAEQLEQDLKVVEAEIARLTSSDEAYKANARASGEGGF